MKVCVLLLTLLFNSVYLDAQVDLHNAGILIVSDSSDMVFVNGSFANTATATFSNKGHLYITGDLNNSQIFEAPASGNLYLAGFATQTVGGTQPFETYNLVTNNPDGFTLNADLSVWGTHTFMKGIVTTSSTPSYLIFNPGSSHIGAGDNSHVNGWVKKIGSDNFVFPVGNGVFMRSAAIESLSGVLEINARYSAPNGTSDNVQTPLELVDSEEFWTIDRETAAGSARIHLNWDDSKVAFPQYDLSEIRVAHYAGAGWTNTGGSATGNVNSTGNIVSNVVNDFGNFTFGSTSFVLPLRFVSITARRKSQCNLVEWTTAAATNTDHFEIERSTDGIDFKPIGSTVSYNSVSAVNYSFYDFELFEGTVWYRIRCIDKDKKFTLSPAVSVIAHQQLSRSMYILNNPALGAIHLYAPEPFTGDSKYHLIGASGQLVQTGTFHVRSPGNVFINLKSEVPPGVYFLHIKNGKEQFREKVIIRK